MKTVRKQIETATLWFHYFFHHSSTAGSSLCVIRDVFKGVALIYENDLKHLDLSLRFKNMARKITHLKVTMNFVRVPLKIEGAFKAAFKTKEEIEILITLYEEEKRFNKRILLRVGAGVCKSVSKMISAASKGVFDPLSILSEQVNFVPAVTKTLHIWSYIKFVGKGCKILFLSGKIIDGEQVVFHVCELTLETFSVVFKVVRLSGLKVHPAFSLTISILSDLYDLFEIFYHVYEQVREFENEEEG
ncbi:MAG: hypothetical protein KDK55_01285 [Chlamydiia bacterium]|nr:hypothetical protein [Chlamydiia bacterium]